MPTSRTRIDADPLLIEGAALADGRSETLKRGVSLLIQNKVIAAIWFDGDEPRRPRGAGKGWCTTA